MRWLILLVTFLGATPILGQEYALLDKDMSQPVRFVTRLPHQDPLNNFIPVERRSLPQFIRDLKEIEKILDPQGVMKKAPSFEVGCVKFTGMVIESSGQPRVDYVLTSLCGGQNISMHLCDARLSNARNAFFIKTWLKYIESGLR